MHTIITDYCIHFSLKSLENFTKENVDYESFLVFSPPVEISQQLLRDIMAQ